MDPLKDGNFVLAQLQGVALDGRAHLAGKLELGDVNLLPLIQKLEVPVQQIHVQAEGGLIVDGPLPVPGGGLRVYGLKVVVQSDGVGVDAHLLQLGLDLFGRGGLAAAGGAGEQDNPGLLLVLRNLLRRSLNLLVESGVALLHKPPGVGADRVVDLLELVRHRNTHLSLSIIFPVPSSPVCRGKCSLQKASKALWFSIIFSGRWMYSRGYFS